MRSPISHAECNHPALKSEWQEAGDPGTLGARREADRAERTRDLETLMQREKLGSTGVAAASRSRTASCPSSRSCRRLFARLDRPIDFESLDGQPVDLIFLLLAPEAAGRGSPQGAGRVARLLRDGGGWRAARVARCRRALRRAGLRSWKRPKRGARRGSRRSSPRPSATGLLLTTRPEFSRRPQHIPASKDGHKQGPPHAGHPSGARRESQENHREDRDASCRNVCCRPRAGARRSNPGPCQYPNRPVTIIVRSRRPAA